LEWRGEGEAGKRMKERGTRLKGAVYKGFGQTETHLNTPWSQKAQQGGEGEEGECLRIRGKNKKGKNLRTARIGNYSLEKKLTRRRKKTTGSS